LRDPDFINLIHNYDIVN